MMVSMKLVIIHVLSAMVIAIFVMKVPMRIAMNASKVDPIGAIKHVLNHATNLETCMSMMLLKILVSFVMIIIILLIGSLVFHYLIPYQSLIIIMNI
jgi:hypothetical protein